MQKITELNPIFEYINDSEIRNFEKRDYKYYSQLNKLNIISYIVFFTLSTGIFLVAASVISGIMIFKYPKIITYILEEEGKFIINASTLSKVIGLSSSSIIGVGCCFIGIGGAFSSRVYDRKIKNRESGSCKDIAGDIMVKDFYPFNNWKIQEDNNRRIEDLTTGRFYQNDDSDHVIRCKALGLLAIGWYTHIVIGLMNIVYRFFRVITFYPFWKVAEGDISTKERAKGWLVDVSRILFAPIFYIFSEISLFYALISPKNGRKMYGSCERLFYGECMLAFCFQPIMDTQYYNFGKPLNYAILKRKIESKKSKDERHLKVFTLECAGKAVLNSIFLSNISIKNYIEFKKEIILFKILKKEKEEESIEEYLNAINMTKKEFESWKEKYKGKIDENNQYKKIQLKDFLIEDIDNYLVFLLIKRSIFFEFLLEEKQLEEKQLKRKYSYPPFEIFRNGKVKIIENDKKVIKEIKELTEKQIKGLLGYKI
ncbi:MAG: hypothetical protein AMS24_04005 [Chlamydiae bacterium SM23_39]|nr:MAG: hypothetical protein AMS24_04005 [Chlamydiae bacterium SM23_39]